MPRNLRRRESVMRAKAKRADALERAELRRESTPRTSAAGPTSAPIKWQDPATRRMIDEALARKRGES